MRAPARPLAPDLFHYLSPRPASAHKSVWKDFGRLGRFKRRTSRTRRCDPLESQPTCDLHRYRKSNVFRFRAFVSRLTIDDSLHAGNVINRRETLSATVIERYMQHPEFD